MTMRVLFLTNFYPPVELGGQGRSCLQVVNGLRARGHETLVLTSMHGTGNQPSEVDNVARLLYLEMDFVPWQNSITFFTSRRSRERHNLDVLQARVTAFKPDVLFVWGMWNMPRSLAAAAEALMPGRVLYRFAEYWPTLPTQHQLYWESPGRTPASELTKVLLRPLALVVLARQPAPTPLRFEHAICVSAATRQALIDAGIPVEHAEVIHTGLDPTPFLSEEVEPDDGGPLRLLYAGRLQESKGLQTTIEALARIKATRGSGRLRLTVAGTGEEKIVRALRQQVVTAGLEDQVTFLGHVAAEEMPALYRRHQALIVPSVWPEPFARVVLEGMASGLLVLASTAGGTGEAIQHGETGLLFAPGDVDDQVNQLLLAVDDAPLRARLAAQARETVVREFTVTSMLDAMENALIGVANAAD